MKSIASITLSLTVVFQTFGDGTTINVDFQPGPNGHKFSANYVGRGVLSADSNELWNAVMPTVAGYDSTWGSGGNFNFDGNFVSEPLFDSAGQITPVTVTIHSGLPLGTTFAVNPSNTWAYNHVASDAQNLMSDYLIAPGGSTNRIQIKNLTPGSVCTLVLFGAGDQSTHRTTFMVGTQTLTTAGVPEEIHTITEGGDYVVFRNIAVADGTLEVFYTGAGSSRDGNFNGLQIMGQWTTSLDAEKQDKDDPKP